LQRFSKDAKENANCGTYRSHAGCRHASIKSLEPLC
jgi:hypothetical protein